MLKKTGIFGETPTLIYIKKQQKLIGTHCINTNKIKALNYRLFKSEFRFEKYLDVLNDKHRCTFCRFRTSNHRLPIEVGRWANVETQ